MKIRFFLLLGILWLNVNIFGQENKIESNGRVGIGTTNPDSRLQIYNDESADSRFGLHVGKGQYGLKIFNGSTGNFFPVIAGRGNNSLSGLLIRGDLQATARKYPAILIRGANYDYSGGILSKQKIFEIQNFTSPLFTLLGSGNLGLGATDPQGKLTVAAAGVNGILLSPDLTNQKRSGRLIFSDNLSSNAIFRYDNKLCFSSGATINGSSGNSKIVLTDDGKVGIGTTYPTVPLEIKNNSYELLRLHRSGDNSNPAFYLHNDGGRISGIVGYNNNKSLVLTEGTANTYFSLSGNGVLIGGSFTEKAKGALEVKGTILAEEIRVEASGQTADFVFEENYPLRNLCQVEEFIKENKHLPDIPSASEMEASGVNLAEMNKLLLQKIEELTLYVIEKEEEVDNLEERVNQIEKILESIYLKVD